MAAADREPPENCAYLVLVLPLILWVQPFFNPAYEYAINVTDGGLIRHLLPSPLNFWSIALLVVAHALIWDVCHYWIHRWQHASPLLWETHKFHHSDTAMNATTQGRHHLLSHLLNLVLTVPILLVLGALSPPALLGLLMFRVWGFVNHANLRVSFGPLTSIIAGPQWHRIHHSTELRHRSKNYATFFPFIDKLFGTYYAPAADEYPPTGLDDTAPEPFLRQAAYSPLIVWYERMRRLVHGAGETVSRKAPRLGFGVFEHLDHLGHAGDVARNLDDRVGFLVADDAHQVDDAVDRGHVDPARVEVLEAGDVEQGGLYARRHRVVGAATPETDRLVGDFDFVDHALDTVEVLDLRLRALLEFRAAQLAAEQQAAVVDHRVDEVVVADERFVAIDRVAGTERKAAVGEHG